MSRLVRAASQGRGRACLPSATLRRGRLLASTTGWGLPVSITSRDTSFCASHMSANAHTSWTGLATTCIQPKIFVRWKCDLATIQIGQLHIGWFSMKQVTLTCQIGWFLHCHKNIFHTREIFAHSGGKTLLFSAGESLEVYRATLGHKVFRNYHFEIYANFSLIILQLENLSQPDITPFQACHSFRPNSETDVFYHPRFGLIRCIATLQHVSRGPGDFVWSHPNVNFR